MKETYDMESTALVVRERSAVLLSPVMDVAEAQMRLRQLQEFLEGYLIEDDPDKGIEGDYGVLPGTKKKSLRKSGADKLCEVYGLYDKYDIKATVDWDRGLFDYEITCTLYSRRDDSVVGSGVGSCSSFESKYRWRQAQRKCPQCGKENIRPSKNQGEGWYCWRKTDGCGATFKQGDPAIEGQVQGRVENPDIVDIKNTVLKMAKKRAKIDATIGATRSSGILTQDLDELPAPSVRVVQVTDKDIPLLETPASVGSAATKGPANVSEAAGHGSSPAPAAQPLKATVSEFDGPATDVHLTPYWDQVKEEVKAKSEKPKVDPSFVEFENCITVAQRKAFARAWKDAAPGDLNSKEVELLRLDWLKRQGFVSPSGEPTSAMIPAALFEDYKRKGTYFAKSLSVNAHGMNITDSDVPF